MKNIAVLASGNGTNLQAVIDHIRNGDLSVNLVLVVSDQRRAFVLKRAEKAGLRSVFIDPKSFGSRQAYEEELVRVLKQACADYIILAGFMRILGPYFVKKFRNKILNIHPALLPAFKGMDSIKQAVRYGVKVTGVTVHFVDEKTDHGPIIAQEAVAVRDSESLEELEARIHEVEHRIYSDAIRKVLSGKLVVRGRRVVSR